jgi:hypothetical protein
MHGAVCCSHCVGLSEIPTFEHLDPRYKVERKLGEEGSVTNSLAMLTAIPEVDLGMLWTVKRREGSSAACLGHHQKCQRTGKFVISRKRA